MTTRMSHLDRYNLLAAKHSKSTVELVLDPKSIAHTRTFPDFSPATEPRQAHPDFTVMPSLHNVLFDARLPYGKHHQVAFVAKTEVIVVEMPCADLNTGLADNALEVQERLRNIYRKAVVERPLILNGEYDEDEIWHQSLTDATEFEYADQYPLVSLQLSKVRALYDAHELVTMHVWDGMADEVAAVIENAAMNWKPAPARVTSVTGSAKPEGFTPTVQEPELTPVKVRRNSYNDLGELVTTEKYALWDDHTDMLYIGGDSPYYDNATKMLDEDKGIPQYEFVDDFIVDMFVLYNNRSIRYYRSNTVVLPLPRLELHSDRKTAIRQIREAHARRTALARDVDSDARLAKFDLKQALRIYQQASRQQELENASPSRRQAMCDRLSVKQLDRSKIDDVAKAEMESQWTDAFITGRIWEISDWQRAEYTDFEIANSGAATLYYQDGALVSEDERITLSRMVREELDADRPVKLGIRYNAHRPAKPLDPNDKPNHQVITDLAISALATNTQGRIFKGASDWHIEHGARLAALKFAKPTVRKRRQTKNVYVVTCHHRFANDGERPVFYVGRGWARQAGSILANGPKGKSEYREWLWKAIKDEESPVRCELERIAAEILKNDIVISDWPELPRDIDKEKLPKAAKKRTPERLSVLAKAIEYVAQEVI